MLAEAKDRLAVTLARAYATFADQAATLDAHLRAILGVPDEPDEYYPWQRGIFEPALVARDGAVDIPAQPGWGVEIRQDWLERAERVISLRD